MKDQIRINYIEFSCQNTDNIKPFYQKAFGWTFTDYGPDYTAFSDGRLDGGFFRSETHSAATNPLVVLYAPQLEEAMDRIKDAGGHIVREIFSFPGGRRFHCSDPDGNILAVWSE